MEKLKNAYLGIVQALIWGTLSVVGPSEVSFAAMRQRSAFTACYADRSDSCLPDKRVTWSEYGAKSDSKQASRRCQESLMIVAKVWMLRIIHMGNSTSVLTSDSNTARPVHVPGNLGFITTTRPIGHGIFQIRRRRKRSLSDCPGHPSLVKGPS